MSKRTYTERARNGPSVDDKPLVWLHGENTQWRLVYRTDDDAIVIAGVFAKKSAATPRGAVAACRERLKRYDDAQAKAQSP